MEVARLARRQGVDVLVGQGEREGTLRAFARPLEALADRCREKGEEEADRVFGRRAKVLAVAQPTLRDLPGQDRYPEPADLEAADAEIRLFAYLSEALREVALERPLLLILDDLQWADELTTSFLEFLLGVGHFAGSRLFFVGTYRSDERSDALSRLIASDQVPHFQLGSLDQKAVGQMVGEMLGLPRAPELFTRFLMERSEGVPFFVAEYLRVAVAEGVLYRDDEGAWHIGEGEGGADSQTYVELPLPRSLEDLVRRRLDDLNGAGLDLLELAAIIGQESELGLLGRAWGRPETQLWESISHLTSRQMVEVSGDRVRLIHARIREVAVGGLTSDRRVELNRQAALAIEALPDAAQASHRAQLGRHWEEAGVTAKARLAYLAGAREAVASMVRAEAETLYRACLRVGGAPPLERARIRHEFAQEVLQFLGRMDEAEGEYRAVRDEASRSGDRELELQAMAGLGIVKLRQSRHDEAMGHFEEARDRAQATGDGAMEAGLVRYLAVAHLRAGDVPGAEKLFDAAINLARSEGDAMLEGHIVGDAVDLYYQQGNFGKARACLELALKTHRSRRDLVGESTCLGNLAALDMEQGRWPEAEQSFVRALEGSEAAGDLRTQGTTLGNYGILLLKQGRSEEARTRLEASLAIARQTRDPRAEAQALSVLATLYKREGRHAEALDSLNRSVTISAELEDPRGEAFCLAARAALLQERGQLEAAMADVERAHRLHQGTRDRRGQGLALKQLATLELIVTGDAERSLDRAKASEALLVEVEEKLELANLFVARGHILLSIGRSASSSIDAAQRLAQELGSHSASRLERELEALVSAQDHFESGRPLVCGRLPEGLSPPIREWLSLQPPRSHPGRRVRPDCGPGPSAFRAGGLRRRRANTTMSEAVPLTPGAEEPPPC